MACLSTPSMPGVPAPPDASVIRAASASHDRSAMILSRRSSLRCRSAVDHVASLHCISLIIKGLHLSSGQLIHPTSLSNCAPSPCGRFSRPPTTTSAPPVHRASGPHSLHIANGPSPVHMPDSSALVGLPVAVFALACRKSMQMLHASDALCAAPDPPPLAHHASLCFFTQNAAIHGAVPLAPHVALVQSLTIALGHLINSEHNTTADS